MTHEELDEAFDGEEYLEFNKIPESERRHSCPDVCAFIYLCEKLGTPRGDVVSGAEHDEIYLAWENEDLTKLTAEDVVYVQRCGVRYSDSYGCLCMFA